ncbi:MAG TPA: hypothetical protein VFU46_01875 [Gemmatimonadales bacterium]|nr:hypothetical protein [Gemmatimonadales bacterium]
MAQPNARLFPALLLAASVAGCSSKTIVYQPEPKKAEKAEARSTAATLGIPPGHLPPPGYCRVWMPGKPPGHQSAARTCAGIERRAPAGSWIVYRPLDDDGDDDEKGKGKGKGKGHGKGHNKVVHVKVVDEHRAGVIVWFRVFDAVSGVLVSEEKA